MTLNAQTRQRLLELVYDLLPEAEAAQLRRQIEDDEELSRAYAEARHTADLLADAARLPAEKIELKHPERTMTTPSEPSAPALPAKLKSNGRGSMPWARGANWAVGLAAAVLLAVSLGGYFIHRGQLKELAAEHLRLLVTGPARIQAGLANEYTIATTTINGAPMPAQVEFALHLADGRLVLGRKETSNQQGLLRVTIPADTELSPEADIRVVAEHQGKREEITTRLGVEPVHYAAHLALDKPLYRPGETLYYRSLSLSRFGLAAERPMPIHFEILDPSGAVVPDSQLDGVTQQGVGNGSFAIPDGLAGGQYTLVVRSLDDAFAEQKRTFFIRRYRLPRLKKELEFTRDSYTPGDEVVADFLAERAEGGAAAAARLRVIATVDEETVYQKTAQADDLGGLQIEFTLPKEIERGDGQLVVVVDDGGTRETIAKTIPINLGKVEVSFYPEGGDLVAGLENRVYFVARDPLGDPVHIEGTVANRRGTDVAYVDTTHEGMGSFSFTPRAGQQYRLKIASPAGVEQEAKLSEVSTKTKVTLTTGVGVFDAESPLEFNIRAAEPDLPLVVTAWCRGVPVGQQTLVTKVENADTGGANPVAIEVGDEVGGVIRLTVYDYSVSPPRPVSERLVYRRMPQRLQVRAAGHSERYSPGEKVSMSLIVTDEKGQPVPAVLGVAVVDDALLNLADDDTPAMTTHFLLTSEVENPEDLEEADFYLGDDTDAAVALDLLLGTQGWRRFVEKTLQELRDEQGDAEQDEQFQRLVALGGPAGPPVMFDNLHNIQENYDAQLAQYHADRTRVLNTLTTMSFFGGLGLVLLVAMLGLLRIVSGVHLWVPAVGATVCCLLIGAILMDPQRLRSGPDGAVAFLSHGIASAETPEAAGATESEEESRLGDEKKKAEGIELPDDAAPGQDMPAEEGAMAADVPAEPKPAPPGVRLAGELAEDDADGRFDADELRLMDRAARKAGRGQGQGQGEGQGMGLKELAQLGNKLRRREKHDVDGKYRADFEDLAKNLERFRFSVRQYAHRHVPGPPGVRTDFAETLYWHPMLIADADGRAEIAFDLSDSITKFRVRADAHGQGRIGSGGGEVISRIPFNLEPKLPLEVNAGDRIDLPLAVVNDTAAELPVELALDHGELVELEGQPKRKLELGAGQRGREYFVLKVTGEKGDCQLTFRGIAGRLADAVKRLLRVVPPGFPRKLSYSGEIDGQREVVVELPEYWVPGSLEVTLSAFPSTLADLQKGMDSILREPCGCFEQASTSNYPNVLSLQYMQEHDVANPAVTRRAKELLKKGYVKLTGYECKQKGYEWFGGDPGHEALTAYGLMEFRDMAQVYDVDAEMIQRTAKWLLARRDGKGGFKRNARALDSFGRAPEDITNAYVTWALASSGQEGIEAEIEHVVELAGKSDDPYLVALAAAAALGAGKTDEGKPLLEKLAQAQADDGHLAGKQGSITRSGGHSLKVETTALAALAWLKMPAFNAQANKAIEWIIKGRRGSGGFGSTQATILALKALVEHSKTARKTTTEGKLIVKRDDLVIGEHAFGAGQQETIVVDGLEAKLEPGANKLAVSLTGENKMPYAVDVTYCTRKPESDENCPVRLSAGLAKKRVKAGETVALRAELSNTSGEGQPMTIAIIGLPAGLEPRNDQLEELKEAGTIDYYETGAREVICYWRSLAPKKKVAIKLDLVAAVPGRYIGPASQTYLYYTSEQKQWADPLEVEITRD